MLNGKDSRTNNAIERILECALYLNWKDFAGDSSPVAVRMEYRTGSTRWLKCLKLWSSASRGHWKLVCEYWMEANPTQRQGITFSKSYSSPGFARMLDAIMQHQGAFAVTNRELRDRVVLIASPDEAQCAVARREMTEALQRITLHHAPGKLSVAIRFAADHPAHPTPNSSHRIN